jgi:arylsulfatase
LARSLLGLILVCAVLPLQASAASQPPNFLVIVADDMGFSDPGCYGGEIQTPNLDHLAANGLRFTQFYSTARCWPSRAALLTGYYAQQVRRDSLPDGKGGGAGGKRPAWAKLLPEMLRPLGYRSYHSGKWHVDGKVLAGGFDASYCIEDHDRHFNPKRHFTNDVPLPPVKPGEEYYTSTAIASYAVQMLAQHQGAHSNNPFFLYLAFTAPHFPLHAPPEDIAVYRERYQVGWDVVRKERLACLKKHRLFRGALPALQPEVWPAWNLPETKLQEQLGAGEVGRAVPWNALSVEQKDVQAAKMTIHAAMVHRMDAEIGRVLEQVRKMGAWDNTVTMFMSDNGASAEQIIRGDMHDQSKSPGAAGTFLSLGPGWSSAANTPFRLHKSWVHEGGIASPFIVHWPARIRDAGKLRHGPCHFIDVAPTLLELAGGAWPRTQGSVQVPVPPGRSVQTLFDRDKRLARDELWWCHDGNRAVRVGDWKLVTDHKKPWELYNLRKDRSETRDLSARYPERVRKLEALWNQRAAEFGALAAESAFWQN